MPQNALLLAIHLLTPDTRHLPPALEIQRETPSSPALSLLFRGKFAR